ncbi:MAG: TerD family protein [Oscillospiraceae bacterium]|nr:TerD family protein [Oscillospiraceae bacterium]
MNFQRGFRDKLEKYININSDFEIDMTINGISDYNCRCFALNESGKLLDNKYMIFANQTVSPDNALKYTAKDKFNISLNNLSPSVNKLSFTININNSNTMSDITACKVRINQNNNTTFELNFVGSDFHSEKAIITVEIYKKDVWRIAVIANGFKDGVNDLFKLYNGFEVTAPVPKLIPKPAPAPMPDIKKSNPTPTPVPSPMPAKVELRKGQKVNLQKKGNSLGEILINLNWSKPPKNFFSFMSRDIDLDLGCLYEMKDGRKGCVQALGNAFGSLNSFPYIALDGDDRTGAIAGGENLRINGNMISQIKRILIYTFIYDGAVNWKQAKGVVTVKCPGSPDIIVKMDEYGSNLTMCAIAMLENCNNETFSVEKIVKFFSNHEPMDRAFNWNMRWVAGKK